MSCEVAPLGGGATSLSYGTTKRWVNEKAQAPLLGQHHYGMRYARGERDAGGLPAMTRSRALQRGVVGVAIRAWG